MSPVIDAGDRVLVETIEARSVRFGDIVLFLRDGTFTVHRIVGRRDAEGPSERLLEKGDRNAAGDSLSPDDVLGRVIAVEKPSGGRLAPADGWQRGFQLLLGFIGRAALLLHGPKDDDRDRGGRRGSDRALRLARRVAGLYVRLGTASGESAAR